MPPLPPVSPPPPSPPPPRIVSTAAEIREAVAENVTEVRLCLAEGAVIALAGQPIVIATGFVTIYSLGKGATIDAEGSSRAFILKQFTTLALQRVHVRDGCTWGGEGGSEITRGHSGGGCFLVNVGARLNLIELEVSGCRLREGDSDVTDNGHTATNPYGGAIAVYAGHVLLNRTTLRNNSALDGGAIFASHGLLVVIESLLQDSRATRLGGCVLLIARAYAYVSGSALQGCHSDGSGGGIAAEDGALIDMHDSNLSNCSSLSNAGGISLGRSGHGVLLRTSLKDCNAGRQGGAIWARGGTLWLTDCNIQSCTAVEAGGGLYSEVAAVTIRGTEISWCYAGPATDECAFDGGDGGGLSIHGGTLHGDTVSIRDCRAKRNGGGLEATSGSLVVLNASRLERCLLHEGFYGQGAAIYTAHTANVTMHNTTVSKCHSELLGGTLYIEGDLKMMNESIVTQCNWKGVSVSGSYESAETGGIIIVLGQGRLTMTNSSVEQCTLIDPRSTDSTDPAAVRESSRYAVVSVSDTSVVEIYHSVFRENKEARSNDKLLGGVASFMIQSGSSLLAVQLQIELPCIDASVAIIDNQAKNLLQTDLLHPPIDWSKRVLSPTVAPVRPLELSWWGAYISGQLAEFWEYASPDLREKPGADDGFNVGDDVRIYLTRLGVEPDVIKSQADWEEAPQPHIALFELQYTLPRDSNAKCPSTLACDGETMVCSADGVAVMRKALWSEPCSAQSTCETGAVCSPHNVSETANLSTSKCTCEEPNLPAPDAPHWEGKSLAPYVREYGCLSPREVRSIGLDRNAEPLELTKTWENDVQVRPLKMFLVETTATGIQKQEIQWSIDTNDPDWSEWLTVQPTRGVIPADEEIDPVGGRVIANVTATTAGVREKDTFKAQLNVTVSVLDRSRPITTRRIPLGGGRGVTDAITGAIGGVIDGALDMLSSDPSAPAEPLTGGNANGMMRSEENVIASIPATFGFVVSPKTSMWGKPRAHHCVYGAERQAAIEADNATQYRHRWVFDLGTTGGLGADGNPIEIPFTICDFEGLNLKHPLGDETPKTETAGAHDARGVVVRDVGFDPRTPEFVYKTEGCWYGGDCSIRDCQSCYNYVKYEFENYCNSNASRPFECFQQKKNITYDSKGKYTLTLAPQTVQTYNLLLFLVNQSDGREQPCGEYLLDESDSTTATYAMIQVQIKCPDGLIELTDKTCGCNRGSSVTGSVCVTDTLSLVLLFLGGLAFALFLIALCVCARRTCIQQRAALAAARRERREQNKRVRTAIHDATTLKFPLCTMPLTRLREFGRLVSYEEARDANVLVCCDSWEKATSFAARHPLIFISHQWLAFSTPDPHLAHYPIMIRAVELLAEKHGLALEDCHIWCDYHSIPQANDATKTLAIGSIGLYAACTCHFIVCAPETFHLDTRLRCDNETYLARGWCRLEQWAFMAANGVEAMHYCELHDGAAVGLHPVLDVASWLETSIKVFMGDFTVDSDKWLLVDVVLGLYGLAYIAKLQREAATSVRGRAVLDRLHIDIEPAGGHPPSPAREKSVVQWWDLLQAQKASIFPSYLFGNLLDLLESELSEAMNRSKGARRKRRKRPAENNGGAKTSPREPNDVKRLAHGRKPERRKSAALFDRDGFEKALERARVGAAYREERHPGHAGVHRRCTRAPGCTSAPSSRSRRRCGGTPPLAASPRWLRPSAPRRAERRGRCPRSEARETPHLRP